jgi:hypothetical protein
MSMSQDTGTELIELLARFIKERDADTPIRLAEQEAELKKRPCKDRELGKWIDGSDFPFLIETLMLSDAVFAQEYPDVRLAAEERKRFAYALEAHCEGCAHCGLKRAYDLEWQARVNKAFSANKEAIGKALARAVGKG